MDDTDLLTEVLAIFIDDTSRRIDALRVHAASGDAEATWREAHAIKGSAASVSGEIVRAVAFEVEKAGRAGDMRKAAALRPALEDAFARFKIAIAADEA
jgi:HPt (histidine-containing phosphotransfer) domain-containing protein